MLAACGETEPADVASRKAAAIEAPSIMVEEPVASVAPATAPQPIAPGSWMGTTMDGEPAAMFGGENTEPEFTLSCDDGSLVFSRPVLLTASEASMTVTAGGETRRVVARSQQEPVPMVTASLPAADSFAGILARTTEPLAVTVSGSESFRMPASPIARGVAAGCIAGA